jgi:hypothetical protein
MSRIMDRVDMIRVKGIEIIPDILVKTHWQCDTASMKEL